MDQLPTTGEVGQRILVLLGSTKKFIGEITALKGELMEVKNVSDETDIEIYRLPR